MGDIEENKKWKLLNRQKDENAIAEIAKTLKDPYKKLKAIDKLSKAHLQAKVAETIEDWRLVLKAIEKIQDPYMKAELAVTIEDPEGKLVAIDMIQEEYWKVELARKIEDDSKLVEAVNKVQSVKGKIRILVKIKNQETRLKVLSQVIDKRQKYELLNHYLENVEESTEEVFEKLEEVLKIFDINEQDISEIKRHLSKMQMKNHIVVKNLDYRLLQSKYIDRFGEDKINLIASHLEIQRKIISLSETQLDILAKCIDNYVQKAKTDEWTIIANAILENFTNHRYDTLCKGIKDIEKIDINILSKILQSKNIFNLTKVEQIEQYEEIKNTYTDKWIKSKNLEYKQLAVLEKVFGHDIDYAKDILKKYGENIELLPESDIKNYVKSIREILNCSEKELEQIYKQCKEVTFVDKVFVERTLRTEYGKLYNEGLLKIKNCEKADENEYGENVYFAGTDFKMIVHSLNAFSDMKEKENYEKDWNRPELISQYFSTSYIRNDMMGIAGAREICYGFDGMEENSLVLSGAIDIYSTSKAFIPTASETREKYYTPDNQINNTEQYNEMVFKRIQNEKKKEPNYIVVFKRNGKIENFEKAKKAQNDWKNAGKDMPIVIVDVDKCLENEKSKVEELLKKYKTSRTPELAKEIYYKIRNNRETDASFCCEIDIEKFKEIFEQNSKKQDECVTEKDLETIYKSVTPTQRQTKMQKILGQITKILGGEEIE